MESHECIEANQYSDVRVLRDDFSWMVEFDIEGGGKAMIDVCYCPFCGKRLQESLPKT